MNEGREGSGAASSLLLARANVLRLLVLREERRHRRNKTLTLLSFPRGDTPAPPALYRLHTDCG